MFAKLAAATVIVGIALPVALEFAPERSELAGAPKRAVSNEHASHPAPAREGPSSERMRQSEAVVAPAPQTHPRATTTPSKPASLDDVASELRLLQQARSALDSGDVAKAKRAVADHRRQFPTGRLVLDRDVLDTILRCRDADVEVSKTALRNFAERHPQAPQLVHLRRQCVRPVVQRPRRPGDSAP